MAKFRRIDRGQERRLTKAKGAGALVPYLWGKEGVGFFVQVIVNKGGLTPVPIGEYVHSNNPKSYKNQKEFNKRKPETHPDQTWFRLYGDDLAAYLKKAGKSIYRIEIDDTVVPCDRGNQRCCQIAVHNRLKQQTAIADLDETEVYVFTWKDDRPNTQKKAVYRFFETVTLSQQVNPPEWEWAVPGSGQEGSIDNPG